MITPMKVEHVMARAMIRLRTERGWTQADLAIRMQAAGCLWTINRVTQLETLRRRVSLFEAVTLSWVFDVPIADLFAGDEDVETPDGGSVPLSDIRATMSGQNVCPQILSMHSARTKRGHISRTLIAEIAAEMSTPSETIET